MSMKKWYVLDPTLYERLRVQSLNNPNPSEDPEIQYAKYVTDYETSKIAEKNLRDETWRQFGDRVKQNLIPSVSTSTPANTALPTSSTGEVAEMLERQLPKMVKNTGVKLYNMVKGLPDVDISANEITIDGVDIGPTRNIIENLTKKVKTMAYDCRALLDKIVASSDYDDIYKLIKNAEASNYMKRASEPLSAAPSLLDLKLPEAASTPATTPLSTPVARNVSIHKRKDKSAISGADTEFFSGDETLASGSGQPAKKEKPKKWLSLFNHNYGR